MFRNIKIYKSSENMKIFYLRRAAVVRTFVFILALFFLSFVIVEQHNSNLIRQLTNKPTTELVTKAENITTITTTPITQIPFHMYRYPLDINFTELFINKSKTGFTHFEPINIYPFTYFKPMKNICKSRKDISLLFMIKSAPGNFAQRQAIRDTWANNKYFKNDTIRHAFLLARTRNNTITNRVSLEKGIFNDIVQMTYFDDYYNNTYKAIGGINWCVRHCSTAKFVMMVDDDMYVATDLLLKYLHGLSRHTVQSLFAGYLPYDNPERNRQEKWYMPVEDYPFNRYPPFISAGATIMSMQTVKRLQMAIPFTKKFKFDDVFLGMVAYKLGIKPIHLSEINVRKRLTHKDKEFKTLVASHFFENPDDLRAAWFNHSMSFRNKQ